MPRDDSNQPLSHAQMARLILVLALGWVLVSALAFVVGFCAVRLLGLQAVEPAPGANQQAGQPRPPAAPRQPAGQPQPPGGASR